MSFRTCNRCGDVIEGIRDGKLMKLRCTCDWERGFHERLRSTVNPCFYRKTMADWDPKIFHNGGYKELIALQNVMAITKIYKYAFEPSENNKEALEHNIAIGKNLFIRGPEHSGRGLLCAMIKMAAARRGISASSLGDYDMLKGELSDAEVFGQSGERAKAILRSKYESPKLMIVEGVRAEPKSTYRQEEKTKRIKGHTSLDALLARRATHSGAMVMTSSDFIGEIADSMGDRMHNILVSPKHTEVLLMLRPDETTSLENALYSRKSALFAVAEELKSKQKDSSSAIQNMVDAEIAAAFEDGLFFEEAFHLKPKMGQDNRRIQEMTDNIQSWKRADLAGPVWRKFVEIRESKDSEYNEGIRKARKEMIESCSFSSKLCEREKEELGGMLSTATRATSERLEKWDKRAEDLKKLMS